MADAAAFEEFVTTRSSRLMRVAVLLTRDHALAEDLLQTALARTWSVWKRIDGDPEPYVHRVLANTYNTWWRRRWHAERPTDLLPEHGEPGGQLAVDERDAVWRALNRLTRQQRAVLVLRYFEDLSEAEVAQALGISAGAVKSHASRALTKLRLDPQLLSGFAVASPRPGTERLVAVRERIKQRRNHRIAGALALLVAIMAGVSVIPILVEKVFLPMKTEIPKYIREYQVTAAAQTTLPGASSATTTWIPFTTDFWVTGICVLPPGHEDIWTMWILINGQEVLSTGCSSGSASIESGMRFKPSEPWFPVGEMATLEVRLEAESGKSFPRGTVATAAFLEKVPFEQRPLPPRPGKLSKLKGYQAQEGSEVVILESGGKTSTSMLWHWNEQSIAFVGNSQTPGLLHIEINGKELTELGFWDYDQRSNGYQINPRDPQFGDFKPERGVLPTVTVRPEYISGDWYVAIVTR
ncbi:hypothetical protein Rhe02_82510 [Rhizocola hellebori]|uniref:HTH luxR-type domain-containing protein n=1 Tax=Rhizocola hellebori TaxID=1392758 RepID=A0A8J3QFT5_9ACTN|nr:SigE family RNA polymerase sigma factor [Rhizocola hellebori]GIH10184.1 hypothetical protein Rhe02_82510 [Rhizocola hellebori]